VNTMPEKTLEALLDHGRCPGDTVLEGVDEARKVLADLASSGLDVEALGEKLQVDGVARLREVLRRPPRHDRGAAGGGRPKTGVRA